MPASRGGDQQRVGAARAREGQRVEEGLVDDLDSRRPAGRRRRIVGQAVDAAARSWSGPRARARRRTSAAITASSTWAVQMLLVAFSRRICCSRVCSAMRRARLAAAVDRDADDPAGHGALVGVAGGEERGVRPAIAHRHAEALGRAEGDVGAQLAGRGRAAPAPGDRWRRWRGRPAPWSGVDDGARVADRARRAGIGQQRAEHGSGRRGRVTGSPTTSSKPRCAGAGLRARPGSAGGCRRRRRRSIGCDLDHAVRHGHGLGGGGGLVEQRGVGELHAGEVDHHLLEVEHGLEPALADLGLVGRVGRVPARDSPARCAGSPGRDACRNSPCRSSRW